MKCSALTLACCVLLAACAAPAPPPEPAPPVSLQAPSAAVAALPVATTAAAPTAPRATPLPRGKRLREVWPQPLPDARHVTALLYSSVAPSADERRSRTNVFWRTDLNALDNRQKIAEVPQESRPIAIAFPGEVSHTGEYIAYLDISQEQASLHIINTKSAEHHLVAEGLTPTNVRGLRQFAWSPDGSRIVFQRHWQNEQGFGKAYYMYIPGANIDPVEVAQIGGADFIGWQDTATILVMHAMKGKQKLQLVSINVDTQSQKLITEAPTTATVGFEELSPDRSKLLMSFRDGTYLLTLGDTQFARFDITGALTVWSADSRFLLALPNLKGESAQVITIDRSQNPTLVNVLPADSGLYRYTILGASPDGRYLAVCEARKLEPNGTRYRTLLYDIVNDRWKPLAEEQGCVQVLGWQ